jgi:hypothetical protein
MTPRPCPLSFLWIVAGILVAVCFPTSAATKDQQYYYTKPPAYMKPAYDGPYHRQNWGGQYQTDPNTGWKGQSKANKNAAVNSNSRQSWNQSYNDFKPTSASKP